MKAIVKGFSEGLEIVLAILFNPEQLQMSNFQSNASNGRLSRRKTSWALA